MLYSIVHNVVLMERDTVLLRKDYIVPVHTDVHGTRNRQSVTVASTHGWSPMTTPTVIIITLGITGICGILLVVDIYRNLHNRPMTARQPDEMGITRLAKVTGIVLFSPALFVVLLLYATILFFNGTVREWLFTTGGHQ